MEFLNYHHLRYFWTVAKEGGLTKAAVKLHVSQPTISAQIQALEGVVGEKLFRRVGRGLALTDTGQHVLSYAEEIFSIGADLLSSLKQRPTSRPLRLHLGVADALPKLVAYRIIEPIFRLQHPVQVSCWETKVSDMLVELAAYRLDVVLADEPASSGVNAKVFNHLLGECGVTFCAETKLARKLKRGFPKSLNGVGGLVTDGEQRAAPVAREVVSRQRRSTSVGWRVRRPCFAPCPRVPRPGFHPSGNPRGEGSCNSLWFWCHWPNGCLPTAILRHHARTQAHPSCRSCDHFRCTPAFVRQELKVTALAFLLGQNSQTIGFLWAISH